MFQDDREYSLILPVAGLEVLAVDIVPGLGLCTAAAGHMVRSFEVLDKLRFEPVVKSGLPAALILQ